jgi:hypothetical protein
VTLSKAPEDTCGGTLAGTTYAFTPTEPQGGSTCVVAVQCTDGTETVSQGTTLTLAETNSPPVLTNLPATVPTIRERAGTFTLTASDPEPPPQVLAYSVGTHGCGFPVSVNATSGVLSWTCGSSVITCGVPITVTDPGSLTDSKLLTIECTNRDPELTSTMPAAASEHVLYTQPITCTDPDGHALALSTASGNTCGALTASGGTGTYAFTPTEAQGGSTCVIALSCTDGVGTVTQTTTVEHRRDQHGSGALEPGRRRDHRAQHARRVHSDGDRLRRPGPDAHLQPREPRRARSLPPLPPAAS